MMARLWIASGLGVWLTSIVYGTLLLNGPLPFMALMSQYLILAYFGLLVLSLVQFFIGVRRQRGFSAVRTLPFLVLYLAFVLAAGTICLFSVPFIFQLITRTMTFFGCSTLRVVHTYCEMRYVPLWGWMGFSGGLPVGTWVLLAWMRCTYLSSVIGANDSERKSGDGTSHD